ncbi:MAG: GumC family protein [Gemmatimonas sp.]
MSSTQLTASSATVPSASRQASEPGQDYLGTAFGAFRRHGLAAFLVFASTLALTTLALMATTPRYRATTTVMIEGHSPQVVKMDSVLPSPPTDQETISSEIQVLLSPDLVGGVARELGLAHDPEFDPNRRGGVRGALRDAVSLAGRMVAPAAAARIGDQIAGPTLTGPAFDSAVVELVERNLTVAGIGRSRAIAITFSSANPATAQSFVNALAERYLANQEERKQTTAEDASRRITGKLASLQHAAADASQRAAAFRAESNLMQGRDSTLVRQQISETSTALTAAIADRIAAESRLHDIERAAKNPTKESSAQVLGSRVIQELVIHEAKLAADLAPLNQALGESNPRLEAARVQVADVKRRIQTEARQIAAGVRGEYASAMERERNLASQVDRLKAEMATVQENEVRLGLLEQNAEAARNVYEVFLKRAKETAADGTVQVADARVISRAATPLRPYSPDPKIGLPVGAVLGLALAFLTTLFMEARDEGIRSQSEAERLTGVPTLGTIPKFGAAAELEPYSLIGSAISDLYLRVALGRRAKTIVVTSALPREGKTTMALCLARMAARSGERTLLIDCDLRRSELSARLSLPIGPGMSDVLRGAAEMPDVMIRDSVVPEMHVARAGAIPANPSDLMASHAAQRILSDLKRQFDFIVIDTAPVMAAPESIALAKAADEVLLFVRWSTTPRAAAVAALRKLQNVGANIVGVVLTMVDVNRISRYSAVDAVTYSKEIRRYYSGEERA